jgi:aminoglycoside 6-adenylyltransferase
VFQECRNEFWWTAPYVSKGLWRGQLLYAQHHLETCTREALRLMLCWQAGAQQGFPVYPGKAGEGLKRYLPPEVWERYCSTYVPCQREALFQALSTACQLFTQASRHTAKALGYSWQDSWDESVPLFMEKTQEDIAALAPAESWDGELLQQIEAHKGKEQTP